jgi:hypothetical protein
VCIAAASPAARFSPDLTKRKKLWELQLEVERSRAARLRAWAVLGELRVILTGAGQELPKPAEKSFVKEGEILGAGAEAGAEKVPAVS